MAFKLGGEVVARSPFSFFFTCSFSSRGTFGLAFLSFFCWQSGHTGLYFAIVFSFRFLRGFRRINLEIVSIANVAYKVSSQYTSWTFCFWSNVVNGAIRSMIFVSVRYFLPNVSFGDIYYFQGINVTICIYRA